MCFLVWLAVFIPALIGGLAGASLFYRASANQSLKGDSAGTLWGLFLISLFVLGIFLSVVSQGNLLSSLGCK
jgi:hypothetical protein